MKKLKLSIDIDDVIFPFMKLFLASINSYTGANHRESDAKSWDLCVEFGWTEEQFMRYYQMFIHSNGFEELETAESDTVSVLASLKEQGHSIILNTSRGAGYTHLYPKVCQSTYWWLNELNVPHNALVFTREKHLVDADIYVDDGVHNFERLIGKRVICYDQPWNHDWTGERIKNLSELLSIVNVKAGLTAKG